MKVRDLKSADYNPRKISEKKLSMLEKSMKEFGESSAIIFNQRSGNLIGGHQRIKHLRPEWEIVKEDCQADPPLSPTSFQISLVPFESGRLVTDESLYPSRSLELVRSTV